MHTLHILNKNPGHPVFSACLAAMGGDDGLLLIENAVLAITDRGLELPATLWVLSADLQARGLPLPEASGQAVDYDDMVRMTVEAERTISW